MRTRMTIFLLAALPAGGCNSTSVIRPNDPGNSLDPAVYSKLGGVHAHHTPEQHAAFLRRVGQLPNDDDAAEGSGIGGGGGGHHH